MKQPNMSQRIKKLAETVSTIESLRSKILYKMLPTLHRDHVARTIFCDNTIWEVVTANKDTLNRISRVLIDNTADTGDHIKLYDKDGAQILPVPTDIVVLYQGTSQNSEQIREAIEAVQTIQKE